MAAFWPDQPTNPPPRPQALLLRASRNLAVSAGFHAEKLGKPKRGAALSMQK
jgi:hypothetical protein